MEQVKLSYRLDLAKESVWLTATPSQAAKASIVYVQELGDFISGPNYYTRRENLPSYLMKYTLSGEGCLEYDGHSYVVQPGSLFWIDCKKPQYYRTSPRKNEWRMLWVHFYGSNCESYYNMFVSQNTGSNVVNLGDTTTKNALEELLSSYRKGGNNLITDVYASGLLTQLMVRCISAAGDQRISSNLPDSVLEVTKYINTHYTERITLDDLAKHLSVNKFYLQKLFKRYTGISPNEYLIQTRLTHAKRNLRTTHQPINQISMDVGINNIGHFINLFKKHEGMTPNAYRQRWYPGTKSASRL